MQFKRGKMRVDDKMAHVNPGESYKTGALVLIDVCSMGIIGGRMRVGDK